jgi:hypothetical protein
MSLHTYRLSLHWTARSRKIWDGSLRYPNYTLQTSHYKQKVSRNESNGPKKSSLKKIATKQKSKCGKQKFCERMSFWVQKKTFQPRWLQDKICMCVRECVCKNVHYTSQTWKRSRCYKSLSGQKINCRERTVSSSRKTWCVRNQDSQIKDRSFLVAKNIFVIIETV